MSIQGVLFDLDVLVNTQKCCCEILNEALRIKGFSPVSYQDYVVRFSGIPLNIMLRVLLPRQPQETYKEIQTLMQRLAPEMENKTAAVCQANVALLKRLKAKGYILGVYASFSHSFISEILRTTGLGNYFDRVFSDLPADVPFTALYSNLFQQMGVPPHQAIICTHLGYPRGVIEEVGAYVFRVNNKAFWPSFERYIDHLPGDRVLRVPFPNGKRKISFKKYVS